MDHELQSMFVLMLLVLPSRTSKLISRLRSRHLSMDSRQSNELVSHRSNQVMQPGSQISNTRLFVDASYAYYNMRYRKWSTLGHFLDLVSRLWSRRHKIK